MQVLEYLSQNPLFEGLSDAELIALSQSVVERRIVSGTVLASDQDDAPCLFLVRSGRVKLTKISETGKEQTIQLYAPGELVGLFALFTGLPFPAEVIAMEDTTILSFQRKNLEAAAQKIPTLMVHLFYALAVRMNECMRTVSVLTLQETSQRIANYLLAESVSRGGIDTVVLSYSHREWAMIIGTTPETISRVLSRFSGDKLIEQKGRIITLLDKEGLRLI